MHRRVVEHELAVTNSADQFHRLRRRRRSRHPARSRAPTALCRRSVQVLADVVKYVAKKRRPNVFAQVKLLLASVSEL